MSGLKRVRADSWAAGLSDADREELLAAYHDSQLTVLEAAEKASKLTGKPVLPGSFSSWYHSQRAAWLAVRARAAYEQLAEEDDSDLDAKTAAALKQARFAIALEDLTATDLAALERNELAREKLALEQERLKLDREKFEAAERRAKQADAAEEVAADDKLSDEEKAARMREIFGLR